MSKIYCSTCKYYDYNTREGVDWCKLNDEETGICGHCEREFEDLEEAIEHYDAIVEENNKFYSLNCEMASKVAELEHRLANCIEPKFKVGQEVWCVKFMKIIKFKINKIEIYRGEAEEENRILYGNWEDMTYQIEENCFATEDEAKKHLEELKNGKV